MATTSSNEPTAHGILKFGDCELHALTREFWRAGRKQPIRRRVFDLMMCLLQHRPTPVSHADIAKAVWGRAEVRPSLLAQAVMQARQLVGDDVDEPQCFVSVRGVGYRFAVAVTEGSQATPDDAQEGELSRFHATFAEAEKALDARDMERAQFAAERALALAIAAGVNRERARALSLAALVAVQRGTLDTAAGLAMQALQLADLEGHTQVSAQARVRLAHVRHLAGDVQGAMANLRQAYGVLDASTMQRERWRCECIMALVYRDLADFDQALAWCARARDTVRHHNAGNHALMESTLEVELQLSKADAQLEQGHPAAALQTYQQALVLNDAMEQAVRQHEVASIRLCWHGNQALACAGLGRLQQAWHHAGEIEKALAAWPSKSGPLYQTWLVNYQGLRAGLLADSRRFEEALDQARQAMDAARSAGLQADVCKLLARAARLCEQAGRYQEANAWLHQRQAAQAQLRSQQALALASVLQAELQADTLRRELLAAREQAQQLALENRSLLQKLQHLESAQHRDDAGFADPLSLHPTFAPRHRDALQRDVPFCLALLSIDDHGVLSSPRGPRSLTTLLRLLAQRLLPLLPAGQHVVRWQPHLLIFSLEGMGQRRAQEVCRDLEVQLNAMVWPHAAEPQAGPAPTFGLRCVDAAADATLEAALHRLLDGAGCAA